MQILIRPNHKAKLAKCSTTSSTLNGARVAPGAEVPILPQVVGQEWHRLHNAVCAFLSCFSTQISQFLVSK